MDSILYSTQWIRRGVAVLVLFLLPGCDQATGGGWIQSASLVLGEKASFGFSVKCRGTEAQGGETTSILYDGQLEWQDGPVRFHGNVEPIDFMAIVGSCADLHEFNIGNVAFQGTYRPQPDGAPGTFTALVQDTGQRGALKGDLVAIALEGGQYAGYGNIGPIQRGNIKVR